MEKVFVTGAAGFIGSNLVDRLLADGKHCRRLGQFLHRPEAISRRGAEKSEFQTHRRRQSRFARAHQGDGGVRFGFSPRRQRRRAFRPRASSDKDFQQNTVATFNVLEAMRANGIKRIAFSSTGCVYGEADIIPTPEDAPFPIQTSLYAASKARRRRHDFTPTAKVLDSRATFSALSRFSANVTRTATSSIFTNSCSNIPTA